MRRPPLALIDLGGMDAEGDLRLQEYFVTTPYVFEALHGLRRRLFIGRKGSGKSALYQQLPNLYRHNGLTDLTVVSLTPDEHVWAAVQQYSEGGMRAEAAYTNAWLYTIAAHLAIELSRKRREWKGRNSHAVAALQQFVAHNYGNGGIDLGRIASKLVGGLSKVNFSALGFGAGFEWNPEESAIGLPIATSLQRLLQLVGFCLEEASAIVLLDRLDDSWDGSAEAHDMLVGLLKAAKRLSDEHPFADSPRCGLKVMIFLRADIYSRLRFDDKDKHRQLEQPLVWTDDELRKLIDLRLPPELTINDLLDAHQGGTQFRYIVDRTFMRPRDLLELLVECFRVAPKGATRLTQEDIFRAEEQYSKWKVADLCQEFARSLPDFRDLVECLRLGPERYESFNELIEMIGEKKFRLVKDYGSRSLLEALFDASVIGFRTGYDESTIAFRCQDDDLVLPADTSLYIHKGLEKGLNLQSRRSWLVRGRRSARR